MNIPTDASTRRLLRTQSTI